MVKEWVLLCIFLLLIFLGGAQNPIVQQPNASLDLEKIAGAKPRNIIFILTDDHRYDAIGFLKTQTFIETPNLDKIAAAGAYLPNAFVTTALCSPSRASILSGLYAHKHQVIDNNNTVSGKLVFFSQYLQQVGYQTAFVGKWHMGGSNASPQRGFNHWVSFEGQGSYLPDSNGLNVDGIKVKQKSYITDELTGYAIDWLKKLETNTPFMLYLSHKGVHADFIPPERYKDDYVNDSFKRPSTMEAGTHQGQPMWVQNQRNSWHGVDFPYHSTLDIDEYYKRYARTLKGVDESVGQLMAYLKENGLLESTLVIYMGDNGFLFGEHGLIDKRNAYEESMRVPMLAYCPEVIKPGIIIKDIVANIDIAPTLLEVAGLKPPSYMDGKSFLPQLKGINSPPLREAVLYEYYWERNYPQTPTMHALRGIKYKYIHYHGIWDTDELYDLESDPHETQNLINVPSLASVVNDMNARLFEQLAQTDGMYLPLYKDHGQQSNLRYKNGSTEAKFPEYLHTDIEMKSGGNKKNY
jgi:N-acetylglucosamine-6-sulfatase